MNTSANDWASTDTSKNMTLAEADKFGNGLAGALLLQISEVFVRTQSNSIISEAELRANQFMSPLPVNLCGYLFLPNCQEFNLATFHANVQAAAASSDPIGNLMALLQQLCPGYTAIPNLFTRIPAVQAVIASSLQTI